MLELDEQLCCLPSAPINGVPKTEKGVYTACKFYQLPSGQGLGAQVRSQFSRVGKLFWFPLRPAYMKGIQVNEFES
jgi:hypothetical protein